MSARGTTITVAPASPDVKPPVRCDIVGVRQTEGKRAANQAVVRVSCGFDARDNALHVVAVAPLDGVVVAEVLEDPADLACCANRYRVALVKLGVVPVELGQTEHLRGDEA
jgi:hypothetical protein